MSSESANNLMNFSASSVPCLLSFFSSAYKRSFRQMGCPSLRQMMDNAHLGGGSPGYHFPWPICNNPWGAYLLLSFNNKLPASSLFFFPNAALFHSAPSISSMDTNVGSPPIVNR